MCQSVNTVLFFPVWNVDLCETHSDFVWITSGRPSSYIQCARISPPGNTRLLFHTALKYTFLLPAHPRREGMKTLPPPTPRDSRPLKAYPPQVRHLIGPRSWHHYVEGRPTSFIRTPRENIVYFRSPRRKTVDQCRSSVPHNTELYSRVDEARFLKVIPL